MPQTQSKFFDDLSRFMTDAAGLADGAKRATAIAADTLADVRERMGVSAPRRDRAVP